MRFPGNRNAKHYFPVTKKGSRIEAGAENDPRRWYLIGLDQTLVDIEVTGAESLAGEFGLRAGESILLSEQEQRHLFEKLAGFSYSFSAGGAVGNTINNFTYLSGEPAVLLGAIDDSIHLGEPAFQYISRTPPAVDLSYLVPVEGRIANAITFINPEGERSFIVAPGISNEFPPEAVPAEVIAGASAVLTTLYCLREAEWPIAKAAMRMMTLAKENQVPVALGLGTASLVREQRQETRQLLQDYVTVAAMNADESEALTEEQDVLLASQKILEWVDMVIITEGPQGLTMAGYVDEAYRRETENKVRSKSIPEYNRWEFSRLMRREDCSKPCKVFSHIHPYRGGPDKLMNTNGAGDAALAAVLHDIIANQYHRQTVPESDKHAAPVRFLTYSSLSRNAQYGNRVAYEVLKGKSPRLEAYVGSDEDN